VFAVVAAICALVLVTSIRTSKAEPPIVTAAIEYADMPMELRVATQKTIALEETLARATDGGSVAGPGASAPGDSGAPSSPSNPAETDDPSDPDAGDISDPPLPRPPGTPGTDDPAVDGDEGPIETRPHGDEDADESEGESETATPEDDPDPDEEEPVGPPDETEDPDEGDEGDGGVGTQENPDGVQDQGQDEAPGQEQGQN